MTTNTHIFALNDRLCTARNIVRAMPDSETKVTLMTLVDDAIDHLMGAQTDMSNTAYKVELLSDKISALNRAIYEPVFSAQYTYPAEGDYNAVREYVEYRKEHDEVFRKYCLTHGRKQLCDRLTDEFGWPVDAHSYTVNLGRNK